MIVKKIVIFIFLCVISTRVPLYKHLLFNLGGTPDRIVSKGQFTSKTGVPNKVI